MLLETVATSDVRFDPASLTSQIPPLALRYLTHAIRPGALLARRAKISFHGDVRIKPHSPWLTFHGQEIIELGRAYHVTARAHLGLIPLTTQDWYEKGESLSRVLLFGFIPVVNRSGTDVTRSARGRLVVESTWLPSTFHPQFGVRWTEDGVTPRLTMPVNKEDVEATLHLEANGQLRELNLKRWGDLTSDRSYTWIPFSAHMEAERTFGDYTVPSQIRASWWGGTEQEFEFFHAIVDDIHYSTM